MDAPAKYFDGKVATAHPVTVTASPAGLVFSLQDGPELTWRYEDLRLANKPDLYGRFVLTSISQRNARLSFANDTGFALIEERAPNLRKRDHRARTRGAWGIAAAVTIVAASVVALVMFVPGVSLAIGRALPASWVEQIGEDVVAQIADGERWCNTSRGTQALARLVRPLEEAGSPDFDLTVRVLDSGIVNAFAAPGGNIVIFRGVIDKAGSPDEVAGVLAHEIAHVVHRHPTESSIRVLGSWLFLQAMLGDSIGTAGTLLVAFAHSRESEAQADSTAVDLLQKVGIATQGLADFFQRLAGEEDDTGTSRIPSFLSTHPPSDERRKAILAAGAQSTGSGPALSDSDWQDLKAICAS